MNGFMHCHLGKEKLYQFCTLPILQELALFPDFFFFVGAKRPPGDKAIQVLRPVNEVDEHQLPVHDHI